MKGIELAREFFNQYGKALLKDFSQYKDRIAVGLCGEGSECFGYDDQFSNDHDFEAGFCLWITQKDYDEYGFKLERAYAKLPKDFMGYKRPFLSPVGGNRHGVIVIEEFYQKFLGVTSIPEDNSWWFYVPSTSLATVTNGQVFVDNLGEFSKIRNQLLNGYPQDIRLKKLASHLVLAGQSGQYNYSRCIMHNEFGAGSLATFEFVKHIISIIYLINNKYEPFYKWAFRGMKDLALLSHLSPLLEKLLDMPNDKKEEKLLLIEKISACIISQLKTEGITKATCLNLETHAYSLTDFIADANIRNMHIMEGI